MSYRVGIEDIEPDHFVAWVLDAPGTFGSGRTRDEAIDAARARVGGEVTIVEEFEAQQGQGGYIINALFQDDLRPVTADEVALARSLLEGTLPRLTKACERRRDSKATDLLDHMSQAEWWYFDRLGMSASREDLPEGPVRRLKAIHQRTISLLPKLVGHEAVPERSGEKWSARKVLRRTLWHRQDHLRQLEQA